MSARRYGWPAWVLRLFGVPVHNPAGQWVAEVWLEWEVTRGSTMCRERFDTTAQAERAARSAARTIDYWLPQRDDFGIRWGVRRALPNERGDPIWTTAMPGSRNHAGEHWSAHPWNRRDAEA